MSQYKINTKDKIMCSDILDITLTYERRGCGLEPGHRQIHSSLDDHLQWQSSVIVS